ncbi:helix-turn-helix domain-containing protein [Chitinophaga sp. SYP-B3965]|uniref:helix-turn-helix domain-containing protein n=1 Tax=Chitinophaga sp. SYP-B3965 TaxID=2663120 RepID=UPI00129A0353|nr:helix-turn-helix domain-containing protein [Chitinophaga sp. SYP-B3965]MRG44927.1 helix-turn-helix domain-containing protein [Chitinophaga sp. SYP-B3965]
MKWEFEDRSTGARFVVCVNEHCLKAEGQLNGQKENINTFVVNKAKEQQVTIDGITYSMPPCSVLPLVANQHFTFERPQDLVSWHFNREFYCIVDHDAEVSCVGFLFYGITHPFFVMLTSAEMESLSAIERLFMEDITLRDNMQGEMLRTVLKRLIIKVTRIAKQQTPIYQRLAEDKLNLVRQFNLLLEINFRKEHEVSFYAMALNKSPKNLASIFSQCNYPSPSQLIKNRIMLEAKRYARYTVKSAKEVGCLLGFDDAAHFSHYFKSNEGMAFSAFKQLV